MQEIKKIDDSRQKKIVLSVIENSSDLERRELASWFEELLVIRSSQIGRIKKFDLIVKSTRAKKIIFPVIKAIYQKLKKTFWNDRSTKSRFAIFGAGAGALFFGGQSAGIAALGGAIGVPLWIVFGAGSAFAGGFLEEIKMFERKNSNTKIIDAEYKIVNVKMNLDQDN